MMAKVSLECVLPQGVLESHAMPLVVVWEPGAALQSRVGGQFGRCLTLLRAVAPHPRVPHDGQSGFGICPASGSAGEPCYALDSGVGARSDAAKCCKVGLEG